MPSFTFLWIKCFFRFKGNKCPIADSKIFKPNEEWTCKLAVLSILILSPMPIFIIFCLVLTTLVQTQSLYLPFLNIESVWMTGGGLAGIFLLGGCLKKLPSSVWHDGFACGGLWAWYGYWEPLFSEGSPMFHVFPIYFALLSAWMLLAFINKSSRFDRESREALRYLQKYLSRFDTCMLAGMVLISLALPEDYLLYPISMTLFIVRSAFQLCLEAIEKE